MLGNARLLVFSQSVMFVIVCKVPYGWDMVSIVGDKCVNCTLRSRMVMFFWARVVAYVWSAANWLIMVVCSEEVVIFQVSSGGLVFWAVLHYQEVWRPSLYEEVDCSLVDAPSLTYWVGLQGICPPFLYHVQHP